MPEENKIKKEDPQVDLDTSGPEVDVTLPEEKVEKEIVTEQEPVKEETVKEVPKEEVKEEPVKEEDTKLEEYSKGVQSRIAKLTRKMREAERREAAALDYAQAVESQRKTMASRFQKADSDNVKKLETTSNGVTVTGVLTATLQANAIDSDHYVDGSIDILFYQFFTDDNCVLKVISIPRHKRDKSIAP